MLDARARVATGLPAADSQGGGQGAGQGEGDAASRLAAGKALGRLFVLAAAFTSVLLSAVLYLGIVLSSTEDAIRDEMRAIYELQLDARSVYSIGSELAYAETDGEIRVARLSVSERIAAISRGIGRKPLDLPPVVDLLAPEAGRDAFEEAHAALDRRLSLLVRSADLLLAAETSLDQAFALSSMRAQTRSDLTVDLAHIAAWYDHLAKRMVHVLHAMLLATLPAMLGLLWLIWLLAIRPALTREAVTAQRLVASEAAARQSAAEAETANQAKSRFLAAMSHEIRTPMNGVVAACELLEPRLIGSEERELAQVIERSGRLLEQVVNDILDFSKIEAGGLELERVAFDPVALAREAEAMHGGPLAGGPVSLALSLDPRAGGRRLGDPLRVRQILDNLLSNAIKFTERGEVRLRLSAPEPGTIELAVADPGIGMSPVQVARVLDPFAQADGSTTRRYGGTGLGLAIVQRLIETMGGTLAIDSALGRGTTMTVRLPLPAAPGVAARQGEARPAGRVAGLRVLVADDNRTNRFLLEKLLAALGCVPHTVESGRLAIEACRLRRFDIALLDISMPGLDGIDTLAGIRALESADGRPPLPAVAATAHAFEHQIEHYLRHGFAAHLAKPIRKEGLERTIAAVMATHHGGARASRLTRPA